MNLLALVNNCMMTKYSLLPSSTVIRKWCFRLFRDFLNDLVSLFQDSTRKFLIKFVHNFCLSNFSILLLLKRISAVAGLKIKGKLIPFSFWTDFSGQLTNHFKKCSLFPSTFQQSYYSHTVILDYFNIKELALSNFAFQYF